VSAFLGHLFGGGHEGADVGTGGHADAGFDGDGVPGMSVFSPTVIAAFLTTVGGLGMIFSTVEATKTGWISAPLAVLGGFVLAAGVIWLFNSIFKRTESSSEGRVAALIGQTATIITPIPTNGVGEIAYVQGGTRYTAPARDYRGTAVGNGQAVRIVRIVGTQFYVQPVY
jgi:membrane protein implicated in regulation of membrane protease activity